MKVSLGNEKGFGKQTRLKKSLTYELVYSWKLFNFKMFFKVYFFFNFL